MLAISPVRKPAILATMLGMQLAGGIIRNSGDTGPNAVQDGPSF
jgi:hypothetical protein